METFEASLGKVFLVYLVKCGYEVPQMCTVHQLRCAYEVLTIYFGNYVSAIHIHIRCTNYLLIQICFRPRIC